MFTGWNTEKDGSGKSYSEGQSLGHYPNVESTENEDLTLYAQWVKADYYKTMQFMNTKEEDVYKRQVIAAHSGLNTAKMFTDLEKMDYGDIFYIHYLGKNICLSLIHI